MNAPIVIKEEIIIKRKKSSSSFSYLYSPRLNSCHRWKALLIDSKDWERGMDIQMQMSSPLEVSRVSKESS